MQGLIIENISNLYKIKTKKGHMKQSKRKIQKRRNNTSSRRQSRNTNTGRRKQKSSNRRNTRKNNIYKKAQNE